MYMKHKTIYVLAILCMLFSSVRSVYAQSQKNLSNTEQQYFFDKEHQINHPPQNFQSAGGISINDKVVEPDIIWKKKRNDEESNNNEIKPIKNESEIVRMLPEQAMRALVDGNFISDSIVAVGGGEGNLLSQLAAKNLYAALGEGMFMAQDIAAGRLMAAYEAYNTLADTQLFGDGFADKEALTSLNSCIYNYINGGAGEAGMKKSWIAGLYHCMGEGDPNEWKRVSVLQKTDTSKVVFDGSIDPWLMTIRKKSKSGDPNNPKVLLTDLLFEHRDPNVDNEEDVTNAQYENGILDDIRDNWLDWYGDYEISFNGDDIKKAQAFGIQTIKIAHNLVKPRDEEKKAGNGNDVQDFDYKFREITKQRCNDFQNLWIKLCESTYSHVGNGEPNVIPDESDRQAFWTKAKENDTEKTLIWNLTDHQMEFNNNFLSAVQTLLEKKKSAELKSDNKACDTIIRGGLDCAQFDGNGNGGNNSENNSNDNYFRAARNYVKYLANSQLLHAVEYSQRFVLERAAGVTNSGDELQSMALELIKRATGVENVQASISTNLFLWGGLVSYINTVAKVSAPMSSSVVKPN